MSRRCTTSHRESFFDLLITLLSLTLSYDSSASIDHPLQRMRQPVHGPTTVFAVNDIIFVSPNATTMPSIPPRRDLPMTTVDLLGHTHWEDKFHDFLPFVPLEPRLDPPFDVLKPIGRHFPVERSNSRWIVAIDLQESWKLLEKTLRELASFLHVDPVPMTPIDATDFPPPSSFGYDKFHASEHGARTAAKKSQKAFLALMGLCSYRLFWHCYKVLDKIVEEQAHVMLSYEKHLYNCGWDYENIATITNSELVDFSLSYRRAGLFIDGSTQRHQEVRKFFWYPGVGVPVWISYGSKPDSRDFPDFPPRIHPSPQQISEAKLHPTIPPSPPVQRPRRLPHAPVNLVSLATTQSTSHRISPSRASTSITPQSQDWNIPGPSDSGWDMDTSQDFEGAASPGWGNVDLSGASEIIDWSQQSSTSGPPSASTSQAPWASIPSPRPVDPLAPDRMTRQIPGESPKDFFDRMKIRIERKIAQETADQRMRRINRARSQSSHPAPGSRAHNRKFYHWPRDLETDQRVRTLLTLGQAQVMWGSYGPNTRVYNDADDEWDLCSELDPNENSDDLIHGWDDDDDEYPPRREPSVSPPPPPYPPLSPGPPTLSPLLPSVPYPPLSPGPPTPSPLLPSVQLSLAATNELDAPAFSLLHDPLWRPVTLTQIALQRFGCVNPPTRLYENNNLGDPMSKLRRALGFIDSNGCDESTENVLRAFFASFGAKEDDHYPHPEIPRDIYDLSPTSTSPLEHNFNRQFKVIIMALEPFRIFFLQEAGHASRRPWTLALFDASTVLESFRRNDRSLEDLVTYFLHSGRQFSTRLLVKSLPLLPKKHSPLISLGWRHADAKVKGHKYIYYERLRAHFFSRPHSRAALLRGGIVWRLAVEALSGFREEDILLGPSTDYSTYGTAIRLGGSIWVDDDLSEHETDLICGVYKTFKGIFWLLNYTHISLIQLI